MTWIVEVRALEPDLSDGAATDTAATWQRLRHAGGEPVSCAAQGEAEAIARDWLAATCVAGAWLSPPRWEYQVVEVPS